MVSRSSVDDGDEAPVKALVAAPRLAPRPIAMVSRSMVGDGDEAPDMKALVAAWRPRAMASVPPLV
jgi:hypothetical protein